MTKNDDYPVHKAVFNNDLESLKKLEEISELSSKDEHGNTPLHLAVILGHNNCIDFLLDKNVPIKIKNTQGWTPLDESISYGDRETITKVYKNLTKQSKNVYKTRRPFLVKAINDIGNFYMEIKWDFQTWVPFISRMLPSDVCKIYKKGCNIRLNTTLCDFDDKKWERGDMSFLFTGDTESGGSLVLLDNKKKIYQKLEQDDKMFLDDEIDFFMSNDIVTVQFCTKNISFARSQSGWFFKEKRAEMIGPYLAEFYSINGLSLKSRKRREHLTEEDLAKNRVSLGNFQLNMPSNESSNDNELSNESNEHNRRKSLVKPPKNKYTWEEYINAEPGKPPCLAREIIFKENVKTFKATLGMCETFPISTSSLLNILEALASFKHINKLREFIEIKLPPGFPVELEIPILPTITAHITFQEFKFDDNLDDNLFIIPENYEKA